MKTIAVVSRKGGVGKTTTTINLAFGLGQRGKRVLIVDADSQANASALLHDFNLSLYHVLMVPDVVAGRSACYSLTEQVYILPADRRLVRAQRDLAAEKNYTCLSDALETVDGPVKFDYIIIDCPPAEDSLFYNALYAADEVIIPVKADYLAYIGAAEMMQVAGEMQCAIAGILPTFYESRQNLDSEILALLKTHFPGLVLEPIRKNVDLASAFAARQSVFDFAPRSIGAQDYKKLVDRYW